MSNDEQPPVLIVGAGPVGQLMALLLSKQGIASRLIDKRQATLDAPKAHAVNPRTLEICESVGVSAERLRELGASANDGGDVRFVATLTGTEFGALPYERQDEAALAATPYPLTNIPQPVFERELQAAIAGDRNIEFARGVACIGVEESAEGVTAKLQDAESGATREDRYAYVIAADGAGSSLRDALGISMAGPEALQDFLMIHFSADLRPFTEGRRGVLFFLFEPGVRGTLIAYDQASTWVLMHPWNPVGEALTDYSDEHCRTLIDAAVGQPVPEAVIENLSPWTMTAQIAERYRAGRVFLVGDAAHRFPPAGGLGLNTGIGDVQNLAWKLAAVLRGEAGDALLDTYEIERQPVARVNSEQSLMNAGKLFELFAAIQGVDSERSLERYAAVAADPQAFPEVAAAVAAQKPHFDSFALQLGYRYASAAIVDAPALPPVTDVSDYQPSWDAGAHFPHCWVTTPEGQVPLQALLPANRFALLLGAAATDALAADPLEQLRFGTDIRLAEDWETLTGLPATGALLIRPDGHIAARFRSLDQSQLDSALATILARGD